MNNINNITEEKLLEDLILNNPELDKLENLLGVFNIFEILDIVNAEIRHSNVLAWLFNPDSNHGLSETFLKQFLKFFISQNKGYIKANVSLFDFEIFNYSDVEVRREWNNIDLIIILNEASKKVVITIENKIGTSEHTDQLKRYRKIIEEEFNSNYEKLYILLLPEEIVPSDDFWTCITYDIIAKLIEDLLESKKEMLSDSVYGFINQYNIILRRYLVGNSEIEEICRLIYRKHQKALDLIFQYKPDIFFEISEYLQKILSKDNEIIMDSAGKTVVHFITKTLDNSIKRKGEGWTKSNRFILYEFLIYSERLVLRLYIGPGEKAYRDKLLQFCIINKEIFGLADRKSIGVKWHTVYQKEFLKKKDYVDANIEDLKEIINSTWKEFCEKDLKRIDECFKNEWKN